MADAPALGAGGRKAVGVRVPSSADLLITANVYAGFADVSRDREVGNSQVWSAKIAEGWKKCTAVNTVNKSDARILPRAGIAWLALLLAASLCFAQDPSKAEQDVQPAVLIHQVPPDYPAAWKREGLQGTVHVRATIAKDGTLQGVTVLDGDARLAKSAEKAVKKWRYRSKMLNGEPVEVQTTIAVVFALKPAR